MCGEAVLVPLSTEHVLGGHDERTSSPGATMSGLIRTPWNEAGPRLLNVASPFSFVMAPTANASSYCAGGPPIPTVWQDGPELPAATTGTMPAAPTSCTAGGRT